MKSYKPKSAGHAPTFWNQNKGQISHAFPLEAQDRGPSESPLGIYLFLVEDKVAIYLSA